MKKFLTLALLAFAALPTLAQTGNQSVIASTTAVNQPGASAWIDGGGVIIPFVATDSETHEESNWIYGGTASPDGAACQVLTTLTKCWKVWHSVGWATTGMSYAECVVLANGAPGACTRLINGAPLTTIGTAASGGRSRGYVQHQGATYYMYVCGATCTTMDVWSSSTGKDDWVLVQAAILSVGAGGSAWDHTQIVDPYVWVEGTTWKMIYSGQLLTGPFGLGYATCTTSCPGGTWTKDGGNPFITADAVNTGGYGNADLHIINGTYWMWAHSTGALATLLPSDIYSWNCGAAGAANKPTTCTQNPLGVPAFGRQNTEEGASTLVGQVADVVVVDRPDINKTFMFYESSLDGTQAGGMQHLKYAVAEMPLATLITTTQGRKPVRDNVSLNSLAVAVHSPPGLGMISVGNSNSAVAFKTGNPTCNLIYMAQSVNTDIGGLFCNEFLASGAGPVLTTINGGLTTGRIQYNAANANSLGGFIVGQKNIAGTETYPLQGYIDSNGNSYDILPAHQIPETTLPPIKAAANAAVYADSTTHTLMANYNNATNAHLLSVTEIGTCTMASGTCTVTWRAAFNATPVVSGTWNGTGTFTTGASLKCTATTTNSVCTSSTGTDTAVIMVVGVGNPN